DEGTGGGFGAGAVTTTTSRTGADLPPPANSSTPKAPRPVAATAPKARATREDRGAAADGPVTPAPVVAGDTGGEDGGARSESRGVSITAQPLEEIVSLGASMDRSLAVRGTNMLSWISSPSGRSASIAVSISSAVWNRSPGSGRSALCAMAAVSG